MYHARGPATLLGNAPLGGAVEPSLCEGERSTIDEGSHAAARCHWSRGPRRRLDRTRSTHHLLVTRGRSRGGPLRPAPAPPPVVRHRSSMFADGHPARHSMSSGSAVPMTLAMLCRKCASALSKLSGLELSAISTPRIPPAPKMGAPMAEAVGGSSEG